MHRSTVEPLIEEDIPYNYNCAEHYIVHAVKNEC